MTQRIRKPFLIVLIILLILGLTAGILFLIFPHILDYHRLRGTDIDKRMRDYPAITETVPADFAARTSHGITVRAPEKYLNPQESNLVLFKSDELKVLVFCADDGVSYPDETGKFTAEEYQHFFDTIGTKMPETLIENIILLRDTLTAATCLRLRGTDYEIFEEMAESKEAVIAVETPYFYHGANFDGLICELPSSKTKVTNVLISDNAHQNYATVTITCNDKTLTHQIIAGLDVTAFLAGN